MLTFPGLIFFIKNNNVLFTLDLYFFAFQDKDITTYSKTVYTDKSMLYSMEFDLVYQTNECGNINISCVIGKEQLSILQISHEFKKDCERKLE